MLRTPWPIKAGVSFINMIKKIAENKNSSVIIALFGFAFPIVALVGVGGGSIGFLVFLSPLIFLFGIWCGYSYLKKEESGYSPIVGILLNGSLLVIVLYLVAIILTGKMHT